MTEKNSWFREHADTIAILSMFALCFWNLNEKMNTKLGEIERELAIIRTVLVMKNIMPETLAKIPEVERKQ